MERFSRGEREREKTDVNGVHWEECDSDEDEGSRLLDEAVKEHLLSTSAKT